MEWANKKPKGIFWVYCIPTRAPAFMEAHENRVIRPCFIQSSECLWVGLLNGLHHLL